MSLPNHLKFSKEHTWISVNDGAVGITDFAQKELGEIVYVDLPAVGTSFNMDAVFGTVEAVKTTSDLFMPVSGKVIEVNGKLKDDPSLINTDAFGEGWLIRVELSNPEETDKLLDATAYEGIIA